ncbi:hypothetical protein P7H41_05485 [Vagococcus fluvialis]|nr:hypothetical protein [Vagococcus fluvialis]MDT2781411.1 hypothetical protein [Vagococcus fluvialis]
MLLTIIVTSIITSLIVSYAWGKWFMNNLTNWMDDFFEEELKQIKKIL